MKALAITTIMALAVALPLILRFRKVQLLPAKESRTAADIQNRLYDIEDFIG